MYITGEDETVTLAAAATGKRIELTGLIISAEAAATVVIQDGTPNTMAVLKFPANGGISAPDLAKGMLRTVDAGTAIEAVITGGPVHIAYSYKFDS